MESEELGKSYASPSLNNLRVGYALTPYLADKALLSSAFTSPNTNP